MLIKPANTEQRSGQVAIAALMPHAPVLVPELAGRHGGAATESVRAMSVCAAHVVKARPDSMVVISPHAPRRRGAFAIWEGGEIAGSLGRFCAPEISVAMPNDESLAARIVDEACSRGLHVWRLNDVEVDHGAIVPLWHLAAAGWHGPTVLIGLNYPGEPGLLELGEAIASAAVRENRRLAVVASGDMSHRLQRGAPAGFDPRAREFDSAFIQCLRSGAYRQLLELDAELQELAAEDAVDSTLVAAAAAGWDADGHEVLSYEGPYGVGYGVAILHDSGSSVAEAGTGRIGTWTTDSFVFGHQLPKLARLSVETAFRGDAEMPGFRAEGLLAERMGVFVTIHQVTGKLRGCVGTLTPRWRNVIQETWHVARDAAFHDHRFPPVAAHEMPRLRFQVSLVFPPVEIQSIEELDPLRYGVVVVAGDGRRGALLPSIEGVDTVEQQLALARQKGGIDASEPVRVQRFATKKFYE